MTGPSASRGERAGRPGATWETALATTGEQYVPDGAPEPRPNRGHEASGRQGRTAQHLDEEHPLMSTQTERWERREPLLHLLTRAARGVLTPAEAPLLRAAVDAELADTEAIATELATQRRVLDEVLRQFVHRTHPGEACLQSGHVPVSTVAAWRAALYPPPADCSCGHPHPADPVGHAATCPATAPQAPPERPSAPRADPSATEGENGTRARGARTGAAGAQR